MKSLNFQITYTSKDYQFLLEPLSDIHMDDINFDDEKFAKVVDRVGKEANRYTIGMGDYGSSIYSYPNENRGTLTIKQDYRDNPEKLYDDMRGTLSPIKNKIIGLVEGNHDYKIHQRGYYNWVKALAEDIGVPYLTTTCLINLQFIPQIKNGNGAAKPTNVKMFATHGRYTGLESSAAITKLKRLASQIDADIYLMGDRHDIDSAKKAFLYVDDEGKLREGTRIFGLCGCFVRGYDINDTGISSFPERMMLYPNRVGTITVAIQPYYGRLNVFA